MKSHVKVHTWNYWGDNVKHGNPLTAATKKQLK